MKIVFFGTHTFAASILEALLAEPAFEVALVITQPDRPVGRQQKIQKSPVKILAEQNKIAVEQPNSLKSYALPACAGRRVTSYELGVTAQYGALIPKHILETPKLGILNIHTSLLPKYRGASPIQTAIMNGDAETGVTIMKMDEGLDTGPILLQKKLSIGPDETCPKVEAKLAKLGAEALLEAIPKYLAGKLSPTPQADAQATYCKQLTRDDGRIDWRRSAREIYNQYRGLTPWPGVWTIWNEKRLKLLDIKLTAVLGGGGGEIIVDKDRLYITARNQALEIIELQLEGKKPMMARDFLRGHKTFVNSILA